MLTYSSLLNLLGSLRTTVEADSKAILTNLGNALRARSKGDAKFYSYLFDVGFIRVPMSCTFNLVVRQSWPSREWIEKHGGRNRKRPHYFTANVKLDLLREYHPDL